MTNVRAIALAGLMCLVVSAQARADVTGFIGVNTTPANRQVSGFAAGLGLLIVGFEFEYTDTTEQPGRRGAVTQGRQRQRAAADAGRVLRVPAVRDDRSRRLQRNARFAQRHGTGVQHRRRSENLAGGTVCGCASTIGYSRWEAVRCTRQRTASMQDINLKF